MFITLDKTQQETKNVEVNEVLTSANATKLGSLLDERIRQLRDNKTEEVVDSVQSVENTEILPSETTLQFQNGEMKESVEKFKQNVEENEETGYTLKNKTKMYLVIYSVVVSVILALIIMNTSVLASLSKSNQAKQAQLAQVTTEYNSVKALSEELSSDSHVIKMAETEYNMVQD